MGKKSELVKDWTKKDDGSSKGVSDKFASKKGSVQPVGTGKKIADKAYPIAKKQDKEMKKINSKKN